MSETFYKFYGKLRLCIGKRFSLSQPSLSMLDLIVIIAHTSGDDHSIHPQYLYRTCTKFSPYFCYSCPSKPALAPHSNTDMLISMTKSCHYDKWTRPGSISEPLQVHTRIYVYFLGSIESHHLVS